MARLDTPTILTNESARPRRRSPFQFSTLNVTLAAFNYTILIVEVLFVFSSNSLPSSSLILQCCLQQQNTSYALHKGNETVLNIRATHLGSQRCGCLETEAPVAPHGGVASIFGNTHPCSRGFCLAFYPRALKTSRRSPRTPGRANATDPIPEVPSGFVPRGLHCPLKFVV